MTLTFCFISSHNFEGIHVKQRFQFSNDSVDRKTASAFKRQSLVYGHDKQEANAFKRARGSECLQVVRNAAGLEY